MVSLFFIPNLMEIKLGRNRGLASALPLVKVFVRKMNKNDSSKILSVKHMAFSPQFVRLIDQWYISITPNWYFSYGDDYHRSGFSEKQLTGMKRLERNRSIYDQFRFWATWLSHCDDEDLFAMTPQSAPMLTFGEILNLEGALFLDEERWATPGRIRY